jgi:hypothetical protein
VGEILRPSGMSRDRHSLFGKPGIDPLRLGVEVRLLAARKNDASALLGQRFSDRAADASAGAGDQRNAAIQAKSVGPRAARGFGHG